MIKEAETTKNFWNGSGKIIEQFKTPEIRLIRESQTYPIMLQNAGRFSNHWFILLSNLFIHINGSNYIAHPLSLIWVELIPESDTSQVQ